MIARERHYELETGYAVTLGGGPSSGELISPRLHLLLGMVVLSVTGLANLWAYVPPLQDFNDWVYQGFLFKSLILHQGASAIALKTWPVPNSFIQFGLGLMMVGLSPIASAKVFVSLYIVIGGYLLFQASKLSPQHATTRFLLLICLALIHAPYWAGELNYQIGLVILTYYIAFDSAQEDHSLFIGVCVSVLLFACHALCVGVLLLYLGSRALLRGSWISSIVSSIPAIILLIWYILADHRPDFVDPKSVLNVEPRLSSLTEWIAYHLYIIAKIGPYQNLIVNNIGDFERSPLFYHIGVLVNVIFAAGMVALFLEWSIKMLRGSLITPPLLTALLCVVIAVINPGRRLGIGNGAERFIYPALILAVLFAPSLRRWQILATFGASFLALFSLYVILVVPATATGRDVPDWSAMNDTSARTRILFWHRPYMYRDQIEAAQQAAVHQFPATADIIYQTSILYKEGTRPPEMTR